MYILKIPKMTENIIQSPRGVEEAESTETLTEPDVAHLGRLVIGGNPSLSEASGIDTSRESIHREDLEMLAKVGVTFAGNFIPRGVLFSSDDFKVGGESIVGSPLYIVEQRFDTPLVRRHEIGHAFIDSHLVPEQPVAPVYWGSITDEEAIALPEDVFRGDSLTKKLYDAAKLIRRGYSEDPLQALIELSAKVNDKRATNQMVITYALEEGDELGFGEVHFEAIYACVNQRIVNELRRSTYLAHGVAKPLDFEEALATYFAIHSHKGNISPEDDDFHQGERAKSYTLMLNERYPKPQELASLLKTHGMRGLLEENADLFGDHTNPGFAMF